MDLNLEFDFSETGKKGSYGTSLVEVFNVRIISEKVEVYGTFRVEDHKGTLDLFTSIPMDFESEKPKGNLLPLTTPPRVTPAAGTVTFYLDLMDKYGNEIIKKSFTLDFMHESVCKSLDKYLLASIYGELGYAEVYYTIPIIALECNIKFQLIKGNNGRGTGHTNVNGRIIAHYGNNYDKSVNADVKQYSWFMLFEKTSKDEPLRLKDEDVLPLSRSSVVVPATSSIVIEMDLKFDHSGGLGQSNQLQHFEMKVPPSIYIVHRQEIVFNGATLKAVVFFSSQIDRS